MKRLLAISVLLLATFQAQAEGLNLRPETWGKNWTREDTYRQAAYTTLLAVDCAQTRYIISHPESGFHEGNPWIGPHPSKGKLNNICAATGLGHFAVSYLLPSKFRNTWQWAAIIIESVTIYGNYAAIGWHLEF